MKVRWLGNACTEIFGDEHILIDPNFVKEPERKADIVLLTHEHDDHFAVEDYEAFGSGRLFAPRTALEKFGVEGTAVEHGDKIGEISVFKSDCWGSEESVSYLYRGILHTGDSAVFPDTEKVKLIFSACFPNYYDVYIAGAKRLDPELVIPYHYSPAEALDDARGLKKRLEEEGIQSKILKIGGSIEI
ncbi:MAG: MBL fold metallo-hydrolase [Euryarchaeota archaeon]|nr:MBL fold metallo-hydrolase [Euryarchaeota archaeon]